MGGFHVHLSVSKEGWIPNIPVDWARARVLFIIQHVFPLCPCVPGPMWDAAGPAGGKTNRAPVLMELICLCGRQTII